MGFSLSKYEHDDDDEQDEAKTSTDVRAICE